MTLLDIIDDGKARLNDKPEAKRDEPTKEPETDDRSRGRYRRL